MRGLRGQYIYGFGGKKAEEVWHGGEICSVVLFSALYIHWVLTIDKSLASQQIPNKAQSRGRRAL